VDVLLVVDMQEGLLRGAPKHDLLAVVERINRLAVRVRRRGGSVVFVQHAGPVGDDFEPLTPGWHLLATIKTEPGDRIVSKTLNDAFFKTSLQSDLAELRADRLLVAGWATDLRRCDYPFGRCAGFQSGRGRRGPHGQRSTASPCGTGH
jgi:nicotinamidase-related amidase